jgi:hypothetical protein
MLLPETFLQRMELTILSQAFNRSDFGTVTLYRQHRTRLHADSVDMHDTCTTLAGITPDVSSRQIQVLAQIMYQQQTRFYLAGIANTVDRDRNRCHSPTSSLSVKRTTNYLRSERANQVG